MSSPSSADRSRHGGGRRRVALLGSTGSIGRQTIDVLEAHADAFDVVALAAATDAARLAAQAARLRPAAIHLRTHVLHDDALFFYDSASGTAATLGTRFATAAVTNSGTGALTITGTSGGLTNTTPMTLTVLPTTVITLPSVWFDGDVGSVGLVGSASYANGTFTVQGAGAQIYGTADAFHFVYQPLLGDGTIVARVVSLQGGSSYVTAGVMIRETLTPGSTNAKTADWGTYGSIYFDVRATTGGSTSELGSVHVALPYWVKLVRSGNTFTSYTSLNGVSWVQLGASQTISMAQNVYVGLAVNSGSTAALATATFDNVSINYP